MTLSHYTIADLVTSFRECGIAEGDIVVAYVGMGFIGFPDLGPNEDAMFHAILEAYQQAVGPGGTLLVPTYTYSFGRGEVFDPATTPSAIGPFSERFRHVPDVKRSIEPMLSVAGLGPGADELLGDLPPDSFGPDSIHERMVAAGAKLCNVGVGFRYTTHLHYVEQREGVPYRFLKIFPGRIVTNGRKEVVRWAYNVRILQDSCDPDFDRLERSAEQTGALRRSAVGKGEVVGISIREFDELCTEGIRSDRWFLARGPSAEPEELGRREAERAGEAAPVLRAAPRGLLGSMLALCTLPAHPLSAACDLVLSTLTADLPTRTYAYPSGTRAGDAVVPERWIQRRLVLEALDSDGWNAGNDFRVPYYCPAFTGELDRSDLVERCRVHEASDAIPMTSLLYEPRWELSTSTRTRDALPSGGYRVDIDTAFSFGLLRVAEVVVPGDADSGVVVMACVDHRGLSNDGLSAAVVACEAFRRLLESGEPQKMTYRLVLSARTVGPLAFFNEWRDILTGTIGIVQLESLGIESPFVLQSIDSSDTSFARRCEGALAASLPTFERVKGDGPWLAKDSELVRHVGIPVTCLCRCDRPLDRSSPYDGHRTTNEDRDFVSEDALETSVDTVVKFLRALDEGR